MRDPRELNPRLPLNNYVIVDVETTGLQPLGGSRLLEIGAVRVTHNKISSTFTTLINPKQSIPLTISALTGITSHQVMGQPTERQAIRLFDDWLHADDILIAHNAIFDITFLDRAYRRATHGRQFFTPHLWLDTLALSRQLHPEWRSHKVAALIHRYHVGTVEAHRALSDALQEEAIYQRMQQEL